MLAILRHTHTGFFITMIGLLCLSLMSPVLAVANSDLLAGDDAIVTNGTPLRTDASYTSEVIADVDTDTPASILDGPFTASDGTPWYHVRVSDLTGYLPAENLDTAVSPEETTDSDTPEAIEEAPEPESLPWKEPVDFGVADDNVVCRDAASSNGNEIVVVSNEQTVEITGEETWAEGIGWTPVNCAGVGGFISSDFITVDEPVKDVADEDVETDATIETSEAETESAEQGAADVSTESADEEVTEDAPVLPWADPIGFAVTTDDVVCRGAAGSDGSEIVVLSAGQTVEITGEVTAAEGINWTPVNCAGVGGFVASEFLAVDVEEAPGEEAPNDIPSADEIVDETLANAPTADEITADVFEEVGLEPAGDEPVDTDEVAADDTTEGVTGEDIPEEVVETDEVVDESLESVETEVVGAEEIVDAVETEVAEADEVVDESLDGVATEVAEADEVVDESLDGVATEVSEAEEVVDESLDGVATEVSEAEEVVDESLDGVATEVSEAEEIVSGQAVEESPSTSPVSDSQIIGTAEVKGTNGQGLPCRTSSSSSSSVITVMPEGLNVMVLSEPDANGWMAIVCGNQVGFASSEFLWSGGSLATDFVAALSSFATVTGTGGGGLNCRSSASINASVIGYFPAGSAVNVRGAAQGDWVPVVCGGSNGWVHGDYLSTSGFSGNTSGDNNSGGGAVTGSATVSGTGGAGLRCRTGAGTNSSTITVVAEGSTVSLRGGAQGAWQPVKCAGQNGFMHTDYLSTGGGGGANDLVDAIEDALPDPEQQPQPSGLGNGDHARTTANLNLRYEPSMGGGVATYAPAGTVILITGSHAGNGYYPVNWDGLKGFMHGDYLSETDSALSERGGSGNPTTPSNPGGGGSSSTGNAIVDYAMGYVGYPYVWATAGPYSFDCSGFTNWVIKNVVGPDIGRGLWTQVVAGTPVSMSNLQPGDLVFHQNTYKAGLSHVGIYIGDNKMVNALNANAGVVVSDITSNYWESRWYGAVRIN